MTASIFIPPQVQYIDANGEPIVGGHIYTYETDMSTPKASYTDYSATVQNTNPVILDSAGRASVWINGAYGIRITDANDVPVYSADNVISYTSYNLDGLTATIDDLNSTTTTGIYVTTNYTVIFTDRGKTVLANASSGDINVTLPSISSVPNKWKICIKKIDFSANKVILVTNGTEKVDDVDDLALYDYGDFVEILADGSEWRIVASQFRGSFVNITTNTTIDLSYNNKTLFCDTSVNNITITLPDIASVGNGFTIAFKTGASFGHFVVVSPSSPSLIDGKTTLPIGEGYESFTLKSNLSKNNWYIVDSHLSVISITGDVKTSYNPNQTGWILYGPTDRTTIGNPSSGAYYAGAVYHDLFIVLYNNQDNTKCPVSGGRTGNAENDWNANKRLSLPEVGGRSFGATGGGIPGISLRALGDNTGEENHVLSTPELAQHGHPIASGTIGTPATANSVGPPAGTPLSTGLTGSSSPHNNMQPTHFLYTFLKL